MKYTCPECEAALSSFGGIILVGRCDDRKTLYVFDARIGEYDHQVLDGMPVEPGSLWEFSCPVCGGSLTTSFKKTLAQLVVEEGEERKTLLFSRIADKQATFLLSDEDAKNFGKDSMQYLSKKR